MFKTNAIVRRWRTRYEGILTDFASLMQPVKMRHIEGDFKKAMDWKREAEAGLTGDSEAKERSLHGTPECAVGFEVLMPKSCRRCS